jgi:IS605 OrfB family transposase
MYRTYTFPIYPDIETKNVLSNMFDELNIFITENTKNVLAIDSVFDETPKLLPISTSFYIDSITKNIIQHKRYGWSEGDNTFFVKLKRHMYFRMMSFSITSQVNIKTRHGKTHSIPYRMREYVKLKIKQTKPVSLKIFKKNNKYLASVLIKIKPSISTGIYKAGLDIGVKVPAVLFTENESIRFYSGGRYRRFLYNKQSSLQKMNRIDLSRKLNVSRKLKDLDHKISAKIVKDLVKLNVKTLNIEDLKYIQLKQSKQINSSWSYERLQRYIIYKCESVGINVVKVNPHYTSRACPNCEEHNVAYKRFYECGCGYKHHRDVVGAINIMHK